MIYDASKQFDIQRARERFNFLVSGQKMIELKEKKPRRSVSQNSYLHLLFSWFGLHTGYTTEEVKQDIFKKIVNPNLFYDGEFGEVVKIERWRSTADLDKGEITLAIDRFRDWSSIEFGIYLPEPSDLVSLQQIEIDVSKQSAKQYL